MRGLTSVEGMWDEAWRKVAGESQAKPVKSKGSWVRYNMGSGSTERFPMGVMMLDMSYSILTVENGAEMKDRNKCQRIMKLLAIAIAVYHVSSTYSIILKYC